MKKLILITALLITGTIYGQTSQEYGDWRYEYAEYQYQHSPKSEIQKKQVGTSCAIELLEENKKQYLRVSYDNGKKVKRYFVTSYEKVKVGQYFMELLSESRVKWSILITEKDKATMMKGLNTTIIFYSNSYK